jgi:threonine/homoserine/homoserine lactone efflux protein
MTSVLSQPSHLQRINNTKRGCSRLQLFQSVTLGLTLGLSLAAPPGPVNAVIAAEGAIRALKGTLVGLGALTADAIFMVLTVSLGTWLPQWASRPLTFAGGVVFLVIAALVLRSRPSTGKPGHVQYLTGLTMGLTNPFQIAWWLTAGLTLVTAFGLAVVASFFAGILLWITLFPQAVRRGVVAFGGRVLVAIKWISAGLLVAYGVWFIYFSLS